MQSKSETNNLFLIYLFHLSVAPWYQLKPFQLQEFLVIFPFSLSQCFFVSNAIKGIGGYDLLMFCSTAN